MKPEHEVIAAIQGLNLESVKLRVMDTELGEGWTREYAENIEAEYKSYLTMLVKYPDDIEDILLSKDVDEFWHTHILDTMKYADDCQNVFGNFLHHNPQAGEHSSADVKKRAALAEKTHRLYQQENRNSQFAAVRSGKVAYCNATVRPDHAAYCNATVRSGKSAYCNATVRPVHAAYCNSTVRADNAAYCNANVRAGKAAYCNAALRTGQASYCNATVRADNAAYCNATVRASNAAYCNANVRADNVALSGGSPQSV